MTVDAIFELVKAHRISISEATAIAQVLALQGVARALDRLGNADAATSMGGLEALGVAITTAAGEIADALESRPVQSVRAAT